MIKAETADRTLIIAILCDAFEDNPSVNYLIRRDERRVKRLMALMAYAFDLCQLSGEAWLSDDRKGCALILMPHQKKTSLSSAWLDLRLIRQAIGFRQLRAALQRERSIKQLQPKGAHAYLWFIGVARKNQGRGTGSKLLKQVIANADSKGLSICLETSVPENISWYEQFGFRAYNQLDPGHTLYFLKREPGQ